MKSLLPLLLLAACSSQAERPILPDSVGGTLRRIADGQYQSTDGRFLVVWHPDGEMWTVFADGNTEPVCEVPDR